MNKIMWFVKPDSISCQWWSLHQYNVPIHVQSQLIPSHAL